MFSFKRKPVEKTGLEKSRDQLLSEMQGLSAGGAEYQKRMVHVKTLTKLIDLEKSEKLSPNTLAVVFGNAVITVIVVAYESRNVVSTKVKDFLTKAFK